MVIGESEEIIYDPFFFNNVIEKEDTIKKR